MEQDLFAKYAFGKAALEKLAAVHPLPENFRLYDAQVLNNSKVSGSMRVTGAEFRRAKSGKNKGQLNIMVKGTKRTVIVVKS